MSRRRRDDGTAMSLDSFLDIVTNVVGGLILIAVVTVLSAGDISVSAGASALTPTEPMAERLVFHCVKGQVFFVDEVGIGRRLVAAVDAGGIRGQAFPGNVRELEGRLGLDLRGRTNPMVLIELLDKVDVGDDVYRVRAELSAALPLTWVYHLRDGAIGDDEARLEGGVSRFATKLDELPAKGYAYFVVHQDSFEVFRLARDLARARGIATGWHPASDGEPLRMNAVGLLGTRVQ